ncbi:hypothetical protein [Oscillatoria salina]|uniref:hypothetical protein n=1 Tax=Oscillatoria salina TaxID=331517 RepID=UPI0013BDCDE1|nr:hypothetical protein [Oscillatoria salina]MBZ8180001.1 hypothetical protein [Oscillatoria salina IIICB1]NET91118.1 hypothetical protein [Kamptonema sp. SIO1D9]
MEKTTVEKELALSRILQIVEQIMESDPWFQERLKKNEIMQVMNSLFNSVSPEETLKIDLEDLTKKISKIMTLEATAGTLNELSSEQIEIFDAFVEGK